MVWNIFIGRLGLAAWPCSLPELLNTCSLAEYGRLEKVLDFLATTKNISLVNIFLILNPKRNSY